MPFDLLSGKFIPEKSNIWRDCVDGYYDWVKEHILDGAPLNEADHCGDPPLILAAGNGGSIRQRCRVRAAADSLPRTGNAAAPCSNGLSSTVTATRRSYDVRRDGLA